MKKSSLALLVSAVFALSACNDEQRLKELTRQLETREQTISQLKSDLEKIQTENTQLSADLAKVRAELSSFDGPIPSLKFNPVTLFAEERKITPKSEKEFNLFGGRVDYAFTTVESGINWLDQLIYRQLLNELQLGIEIDEKALKNDTSTPKQQVLAVIKTAYTQAIEALEAGEAAASEQYSVTQDFIGQRQNVLSFSSVHYTYGGGAHGMYWTNYIHIDTDKKSIIRLDDIFPEKTREKLTALLWDRYKQHSSNENRELYTSQNDFTVSDAFYFTADGVNFVYPPYVLGVYADGEITLPLYWDKLKNIINPDYAWK